MKRIVVNADTGVGDSLTILYALRSPNSHVEGIATCFGNDNTEQSADSCLRLIRLSGCGYEVSAVMGSNESLDGVFDSAPAHIHRDNGIGNVELPRSSQKPVDETTWDFTIRKTGGLKDELTIITAGRMISLACALEKGPGLLSKVKKAMVMGRTLKKPSNVNPCTEANIHGGTETADRILRVGLNLALVGLDVTTKAFIMDRSVKNLYTHCREKCRAIADYIRDVLKFCFEFHRVSMGMAGACVVHDPLVVLIAEDPSLGVFRIIGAGVEYGHELFRGMTRADMGFVPVLDREETAVYVEVDSEKATRRLFSLFQDMTPGRYSKK